MTNKEISFFSQLTGKLKNLYCQDGKNKKQHFYILIFRIILILTGIGIPVITQYFKPLHILTHEFTQLYTIITVVLLFFLSFWLTKRLNNKLKGHLFIEQMQEISLLIISGVIFMFFITLGFMYLFNLLYWNCYFHKGVPFFLITWFPAILWAIVSGILTGKFNWKWYKALAFLLLIFVFSFIQDLIQLINGAHIVDFIIGEPLAFDQRSPMIISETHLFHRIFVLLFTLCSWYLGLWYLGAKQSSTTNKYPGTLLNIRRKAILLSSILILTVAGMGSYFGIGWGKGAINYELSKKHISKNFIFHFSPGGFAENNIEAIEKNAEWYMHRLCTHWEIKPVKPVNVYISNDLRRLTGINASHAVSNNIFITNYGLVSSTFYHELVHAIHQESLKPSLKVWLNRGIIEGLAQAYENELAFLPEAHKEYAGALKAGRLPSAVEFMSLTGFWKLNERIAYSASGSFVGFLIYNYGIDKFKEFQKELNYKKVYGENLAGLDIKWKNFLDVIPLDLENRITGGDAFDSSLLNSYSEDCCPKLGTAEPLIKTKARKLFISGHYVKAYKIYLDLFETTGKARWGYQAALCLQKQQKYTEALLLFDKLLDQNKADNFEKIKITKVKLLIFTLMQDWQKLYETFEKLKLYNNKIPDKKMELIETLLRNTNIRSAAARSLIIEDNYNRRHMLEKLIKEYPENPSIQYLYAIKAISPVPLSFNRYITPEEESRIIELTRILKKSPESLIYRVDELFYYIRISVFFSNYALAEQLCKLMFENTDELVIRYRTQIWKDRIDFIKPKKK